jgi:L,D-transpeptidase catalytic domain
MLAIGMKRTLALGVAAAALTSFLLPSSSAEARQRPNYRERERPQAAAEPATRKPDGPVNIIISLGSQRLWLYDKHGLVATSIVSTGTAGFPTPAGVFAILDKEVQHYSNIYGGASMPFMQRLTMSGVALHSGATTGRPASHGCIRLPHAFARHLFVLTGLGARVIIAPNEPAPQEIAHPSLFVRKAVPPVPPEETDTSRPAVVAAAGGFDLQRGSGDAGVGKITTWRAGVLQALPIAVFVSKAEGKVYVRHGFRRLLEAPVEIADSDRPIGTHVYTALEFKDDGAAMRWISVSVPASSGGAVPARKVSRASRNESEPLLPRSSGPPSTAAEALARFELPKETRDRISQMLTPGVTLIVSDHGHNREMRDNGTTDFIVLTR